MSLLMYLILTVTVILLSKYVSEKPIDFYQSKGLLQLNEREKIKDRAALVAIFLLLGAVLIFRVNIGNDYFRYTQILHELRVDGYVITEPGFNLLCKFLLKTKIWWNQAYFLCFAVIGILTLLFFLKAMYRLSEEFWITLFLFMTLGMYFQAFSTVRYYLALAIVMYAMKYILQKKYVPFVLWILVAASFHKIALIALLAYPLAMISWKKWHLGIFGVFALQFLICKDFYFALMLKLYPSYENEQQYLFDGTSFANIVKCVLVLGLCIRYYKPCIENQPKNRFFYHLNLMALALYTCGYYVPIISRMGYLLNISQLFLIPAFVKATKDCKKRKLLLAGVVLVGIFYYILFQREMINTLKIVPYQSWFFQDMTPINMLEQ